MESATPPRDTAWAMSEENVEIAKRISAAGRRGDLEAALEFVAEDVVMTNLGWTLDTPRTVHGRDELAAYYAEVTRVFDGFERQVEEWIDADDWVITVGSWVGVGKGSGARVETGRTASAARFHQGKLVELIIGLPDKEAALEAAGLRE
jgi:ketosteroid isomerase-like protein